MNHRLKLNFEYQDSHASMRAERIANGMSHTLLFTNWMFMVG